MAERSKTNSFFGIINEYAFVAQNQPHMTVLFEYFDSTVGV